MKKIRTILSGQWHLFCTTTGLRGFAYLHDSTKIWERILWLITISAGIFMTVWDVTELVLTFSSNPTITQLQMRSGRPFKLDNFTICIEFSAEKLHNFGLNVSNDDEISNFVRSIVHPNISVYYKQQFDLITESLKKFPISTGSLQFYFIDIVDVNFPKLIYVTTMLLIQTIRSEFYPAMQVSESLKVLANFYQQHNIMLPDLMQTVGGSLMCAMGLTIGIKDLTNDYTTVRYCLPEKITWFGPNPFYEPNKNQLCFGLAQPETLSFYSRTNRLRMKLLYSNIFEERETLDSISLHFGPDPLKFPEIENLYFIDLGMSNTAFIKVEGMYRLMPNGNSKCQNEFSMVTCKLERVTACIERRNLCSPRFSYFLNHQQYNKSCDSISYATNEIINEFHTWTSEYEFKTKCIQDCNPPCVRKLYGLAQKVWEPKTNVTRFELATESFIFPFFEEKSAITFRQFLAQLGGNLSLWMGAGFLILLHLITFIIKIPLAFT